MTEKPPQDMSGGLVLGILFLTVGVGTLVLTLAFMHGAGAL